MIERGRRPWRRAVAWLALLGPLFFLSYGWANARAAALPFVASANYAWEASIPFWAWTIVPYWSIDLFYGLSLLVCRDRHELDRHALRLLTAQAIAIACFVAFPLKLAYAAPPVEGMFGAMFAALHAFDQPFNQAPSLHIVLLVLLWLRFGAHLRGAWRWVLHAWAALIGVSVLTTWQHHFIDLPTGLLAGFACAWLWPIGQPAPWQGVRVTRDPLRWKLAALYWFGAICAFALALAMRGWAWWLAWPAVALLMVALCYAWFGAQGFQKSATGRMSVASRWLYAPYLLGAKVNAWAWTRKSPQPAEIAAGVWLGRLPHRGDRVAAASLVDVCAELPAPERPAVRVIAVPMLDLVAPTPAQLRSAVAAIEDARTAGPVLVCCALGYSRSALAIAAWLIETGRAPDAAAAIACVRAVRPAIVLRERHRALLSGQGGGVPA